MKTFTITWEPELGGRSALVACDDCGDARLIIEHDEPITASTDSHGIANLFDWDTAILSVEHDGEYIHVTTA